MKIYPSNLNHIRYTKPTNEEIKQKYNFPCSITVLNKALSTAEVFYYDGEGNEFPQGRFNIPSDYLFQKALLKTDTAPTIKGLYPLLETGIYTKLGGINAQSGKLNFASFDGTNWSKVEVAMPENNVKIPLWEAKTYSGYVQVMKDNVLYSLPDGVSATATDIPNPSSLLWKANINANDAAKVGKNIFNKDAFTVNTFINPASGAYITLTDAKVVKTPVQPSTQYTLSGHLIPGPSFNLVLRYEDINGNLLSYTSITSNNNLTFTTPENCVTVAMSVYRPDYPQDYSKIQIELGATATVFAKYIKFIDTSFSNYFGARYVYTSDGFMTLEDYLSSKNTSEMIITSKNLFNKNGILNNFYIDTSTGAEKGGANYAISNYIPVEPNTYYVISGRTGATGNIAFYDANKVLINTPPVGTTWNPGFMNGTFKTGSTTAFVRMNVKDHTGVGDIDNIQFERGTIATPYVAYSEKQMMTKVGGLPVYSSNPKDAVPDNVIKIVAFGDSITSRTDNWTKAFLTKVPSFITNMAISGAKIAWREGTTETTNPPVDANDNNVLWNQIKKWEATTPTVPDAIIIAIGTNDISQQSPIGTFADAFAQSEATTSQMTTANAFRKALQYLLLNYPNTQIFYCTPLQSKTGIRNWTKLNDLSNILTAIAKRLNVNVIDCFNESGIIDEYEGNGVAGRYYVDGTHPTAEGAAKQGKYIATRFKTRYVYP